MTFFPTRVDPANPTWAHSRYVANRGAVTHLHQVIDLYSARDPGFADAGAVNAGIGLYLYIVSRVPLGLIV